MDTEGTESSGGSVHSVPTFDMGVQWEGSRTFRDVEHNSEETGNSEVQGALLLSSD